MAWEDLHNLSQHEKQEHENAYGGYNDFPRNWCEIPDAEMAQSSFFTWSPVLVEHRQMLYPTVEVDGRRVRDYDNKQPMVGAQLFFMNDGSGYGLVNDYWEKTIKWFRFDGPCDHELDGTSRSMHYTDYKCKKCNYRTAIDSSG